MAARYALIITRKQDIALLITRGNNWQYWTFSKVQYFIVERAVATHFLRLVYALREDIQPFLVNSPQDTIGDLLGRPPRCFELAGCYC